jgi:hypothetical protein
MRDRGTRSCARAGRRWVAGAADKLHAGPHGVPNSPRHCDSESSGDRGRRRNRTGSRPSPVGYRLRDRSLSLFMSRVGVGEGNQVRRRLSRAQARDGELGPRPPFRWMADSDLRSADATRQRRKVLGRVGRRYARTAEKATHPVRPGADWPVPLSRRGVFEQRHSEYPELPRTSSRRGRGAPGHRVCALLALGIGTGETAAAVLDVHPTAASLEWTKPRHAAVARRRLPSENVAELLVGRVRDELPPGPFDAIATSLAVHHLTARQ